MNGLLSPPTTTEDTTTTSTTTTTVEPSTTTTTSTTVAETSVPVETALTRQDVEVVQYGLVGGMALIIALLVAILIRGGA